MRWKVALDSDGNEIPVPWWYDPVADGPPEPCEPSDPTFTPPYPWVTARVGVLASVIEAMGSPLPTYAPQQAIEREIFRTLGLKHPWDEVDDSEQG